MNARLANPEEAGQAVEWFSSTERNCFDPDVLGHPTTMTLCVENGQPLLYMPLQLTLTMESLGKKPGIRKREMAFALVEMIEAVKKLAFQMKITEVYFLCIESTVINQAEKFGFKRVMEDKEKGMVLFTMKVPNG